MFRFLPWTGLFALAATIAFAADQASQIHIGLTVLEGPAGKTKTSPLTKTSAPKAGSRLQVWIAATEPCHVLVVGFDAAGQIAYPDQPVLLDMEANGRQQIPSAGWKWEAPDSIRELNVLLVDHASPSRRALSKLVDAMREAAPAAVRAKQVTELRRMIDSLTQRDTASADYSVKVQPAALGGLLRGAPCDWCKDAQRVSLTPAGSYLVRQRFQ